MRYSLDWDDTLVNVHTQQWLPGALERIRAHQRDGDTVFIHTCRANWPEGRASVEAALAAAGLHGIVVHAKPDADVYVDDKAQRPDEWLSQRPVPRARAPKHPPARVLVMPDTWRLL